VKFGEQLNFGFDSRSQTLFVEGPAIGKTTSLAPIANHLQAGKPFAFTATRNAANHLTLSINGKPVYQTDRLRGPVGTIALRPHRNKIDLLAAHLSGSITLLKNGLTLRRSTVPILTDGEPHPLLTLHLVLDHPRTLTTARIALQGKPDLLSLQLRAPDGTLLAVYDMRYNSSRDLQEHIDIGLSRSTDRGQTWSAPENLTAALKNPAWFLFAPAPGNGITLSDGTLVLPTQGRDETGLPFSNLTWSRDHGKTWTVSSPARSGTTECAVAQLSDGSLLLNMRDNRNRTDKSATNGRALSLTRDLGNTWAFHPADHSALPEPTCMASMISHALPDSRHALLFSNPRNKNSRSDLTIQPSLDDGKTWPAAHHLLLDSETGYGYSSLVMIDDHTVGILYESSQADMTFQMIPLAVLLK